MRTAPARPSGAVLGRSVVSPEGLGLALLVAAAATAILVGAVTRGQRGRASGWSTPPRSSQSRSSSSRSSRGEGEGNLPLFLPALLTFAAAVLVARLLDRRSGFVERLARGRTLGLRLASLSLARNPGYAVAATAFLVVSFSLALFAESYRSTLSRGERDQAAHRVPLDYVPGRTCGG